ncbi:hypothetical protein DL765_006122 [Monosporascus sp. GIB2]|nr:hypothetical protein DL765_006122 [Monosporascus sp. GIB2]
MGEMSGPGPEVPPKLPPESLSLEESKQADEREERLIDGVNPTPSIHPNDHELPTASDTDPISRKPLRQTYARDMTQLDRGANRFSVRQEESLRAISPPLDAKKLQSQLAESEENTRRILEQLQKERQEKKDLREAYEERSGSHEAIIRSLNLELKETKADLEDTRSHILSMQPYVKDITPEEMARDFDDLYDAVLYGSLTQFTDMLQSIEESMRESVRPKRDLFASVKRRAFYESLDRKIIGPAQELQEKMQSSIHYYWFTLNQYEGSSYGAVSDHARASKLLAELDEVDCEDVFGNRRRWDPAKLHNPPCQDDLLHKLYPICTLSPRLMMRQVGRGEIVKEPRVIRKQRTLVAWATPETRASRLAEEPQTLMNAIYSMRESRSNGAGGFLKKLL